MARRDDATESDASALGTRISSIADAADRPCDELVRLIAEATATTCWLFARHPASPRFELVGRPPAGAVAMTATAVELGATATATSGVDLADPAGAARDPAASAWLRANGIDSMLTVPIRSRVTNAVLAAAPAPASAVELEMLCICVADVIDRHAPWVLVERATGELRVLRRSRLVLERAATVLVEHGGGRAALVDAAGGLRELGAGGGLGELLGVPAAATLLADAAAGEAGQAVVPFEGGAVELRAEPDGVGGVIAVTREVAALAATSRTGGRALAERLSAIEDIATATRGEVHDDGLQVIGAVGHRLGMVAAGNAELGEELNGMVAALGAACDAIAGALEQLPAALGPGRSLLGGLEAMRTSRGDHVNVRADVATDVTATTAAALYAFARDVVVALDDHDAAIDLLARPAGVTLTISGRGRPRDGMHEYALAAATERVRALGGSASVQQTAAGDVEATASFSQVAHLH